MSAKWNQHHAIELYRGIIELALTSRTQLYSRPGLSDVNGHGGDTINRKLQQALKSLGGAIGIDNSIVVFNEELAKLKRGGGRNMTPKKSPNKEDGQEAGASSKKRKIQHDKDEVKKVEEEQEDQFWTT